MELEYSYSEKHEEIKAELLAVQLANQINVAMAKAGIKAETVPVKKKVKKLNFKTNKNKQ